MNGIFDIWAPYRAKTHRHARTRPIESSQLMYVMCAIRYAVCVIPLRLRRVTHTHTPTQRDEVAKVYLVTEIQWAQKMRKIG